MGFHFFSLKTVIFPRIVWLALLARFTIFNFIFLASVLHCFLVLLFYINFLHSCCLSFSFFVPSLAFLPSLILFAFFSSFSSSFLWYIFPRYSRSFYISGSFFTLFFNSLFRCICSYFIDNCLCYCFSIFLQSLSLLSFFFSLPSFLHPGFIFLSFHLSHILPHPVILSFYSPPVFSSLLHSHSPSFFHPYLGVTRGYPLVWSVILVIRMCCVGLNEVQVSRYNQGENLFTCKNG